MCQNAFFAGVLFECFATCESSVTEYGFGFRSLMSDDEAVVPVGRGRGGRGVAVLPEGMWDSLNSSSSGSSSSNGYHYSYNSRI